MIRDPSDGSVREVVDEKPQSMSTKAVKLNTDNDLMSSTTSGLRQPTRTDAQERLERSRQWLKDYQSKQERQHERGNSSGEELPQAGHSVEGERQAKPAASSR